MGHRGWHNGAVSAVFPAVPSQFASIWSWNLCSRNVSSSLHCLSAAGAVGRAGAGDACLIPTCLEQLIGACLASGANEASQTSLLLAFLIENWPDVSCDIQTLFLLRRGIKTNFLFHLAPNPCCILHWKTFSAKEERSKERRGNHFD